MKRVSQAMADLTTPVVVYKAPVGFLNNRPLYNGIVPEL